MVCIVFHSQLDCAPRTRDLFTLRMRCEDPRRVLIITKTGLSVVGIRANESDLPLPAWPSPDKHHHTEESHQPEACQQDHRDPSRQLPTRALGINDTFIPLVGRDAPAPAEPGALGKQHIIPARQPDPQRHRCDSPDDASAQTPA